ncbi:hypothetical protein E0E54_13360 [Azotobacter chroococcum]|uniref:AAA family ATPase n=1 Tax=Azotobacter chroococcum TaxID=353 RepID=UPI001040BA1E|nr:hypothetical protein [Azotobacter chroococcum]TBW34777.1 hypothetical protein E0E54_13360 [Azotobacter chroococcum]
MKLKKVAIEAFRAYKSKLDGTFDFTVDGNKPSGFVSIYAPNGFGKSSFYDAVEWALTNNVSRYIADTHKKNNELAAKGTKLDGVPQYILRNNDVESTVETSVLVSTTERDFFRKLNNVRVDSRDIRFNDRDTEVGTREFRNIILSQDAIDRFVREVRPEDRYDLFMEHVGGNAEQVRKSLHILEHDNNSVLVGLKDRRTEVSSQIVNGIDDNVFLEYNNTVKSLALSGEVVQPISSDLTSIQELEIVSSLLTRKHQLNLEIKHFDALVESLQQKLDRAGEVASLLLKKSELEPEIKRINKGIADSQKYQELYQLHQRKINDQGLALAVTNNLNELKSELPQFMEFYAVLEQGHLEHKNFHSIRVDLESKIEKAAFELKGIESDIGSCQINLQNLNELQVNSGNVYVDIASARQLISGIDSEIEALDANRNVDLASIEARRLELAQISSLEVSVEGLLSSDTSTLDIDGITFELSELRTKLINYEEQLHSLLNVQKALTEQSSTIERLVGLGLEHISLHPTKNCPLCAHEHPNDEALKNAIAENKFASDALQSNSQMIELSLLLKEEVERRIKEILTEVSNKKNKTVDSIRAAIQELDENLNRYQEYRLHLEAQRSTAVDKVSSRNVLIFGLEPADLKVRLNKDKETATELLRKLVDDKNNAQKDIERLRSELNDLVGRMAVYQGQELSIKQSPLYIKFDNFIRSTATNVKSVPVVIDEAISNASVTMQTISRDMADLVDRCESLKAEMESEGNWVDLEFLRARQAALSLEISQYDAQTLPYLRGLAELVGDIKFKTEAEFKSAIKQKLSTISLDLERVNVILASYELLETQLKALVPYVQNIARRKELAQIEVEIDKHTKVGLLLAEEMNKVAVCLERQIRSYFYTDLINGIYRKIDPHPAFKKVEFSPKFGVGERPQLNIVISDEQGSVVSPNLYFSSAQLNILSLSVFLARAIHAKHNGKPLGLILIDDPIHSMDSINILSMIDMLRNISVQFDKQIIISTHDENFFELLQKKVPADIFDSKFIALESYGVVAKGESSKERVSILSPK